MRSRLSFVLGLTLAFAPLMAQAQNVVQRGDVIVHHSVVPTTMLAPEVATRNGITRSASRALLNVAVQRRGEEPLPQAISARVQASARNLTGQRQTIALREVREGEAIYYLGEVRVQHEETLDFEIEVLTEGSSAPIAVRFSQQFFTR